MQFFLGKIEKFHSHLFDQLQTLKLRYLKATLDFNVVTIFKSTYTALTLLLWKAILELQLIKTRPSSNVLLSSPVLVIFEESYLFLRSQ